ncbi:hypothetical protein LCGC14_2498500, partial [marine sediment metagenome]
MEKKEEKKLKNVNPKQEQVHDLLFNKEVGWQEIIYDLINTGQLDPWDVDITLLTNKYLEKLHELEEDYFISSKVLLAAALLLRIKSEILLNKYIKSIDEILFGKKDTKPRQIERIELENEIPELRRMWGNQLLIVQNLTSFIQEFDQNIANIDDPDFYFYKSEHLTLMYMSNAKYFDSLDIGATLRKLELLRSDVEENILGGNDRWFSGWFSDNVYWTLKEIENQVTFLLVMLFLFSSPVFILALFLAYYSFGLIKRQKFQQLGVMLSRGIKRSQLSILLILEVFVSLIIAIIMGILLSIPFSTIFVQSSGLLEFDNPRSPVILLLDLVRFITPIGFILIVITNLFSIYRTSNITLATIEKHMNKEQTDPFWQKKYLDVVFLILGIGIILVVSEINLRQDRDMNLAFLNFLLIPAPILLVTGAVMFISRIFVIVTDRISVLLWKKKSGLLSFSLKNVVRHKQA